MKTKTYTILRGKNKETLFDLKDLLAKQVAELALHIETKNVAHSVRQQNIAARMIAEIKETQSLIKEKNSVKRKPYSITG